MDWALADGAMSGVMSALEVGKGWQMAGGERVRARSIERRRARRLLWALRMANSGAAENILMLLSNKHGVFYLFWVIIGGGNGDGRRAEVKSFANVTYGRQLERAKLFCAGRFRAEAALRLTLAPRATPSNTDKAIFREIIGTGRPALQRIERVRLREGPRAVCDVILGTGTAIITLSPGGIVERWLAWQRRSPILLKLRPVSSPIMVTRREVQRLVSPRGR